LADSPSTDLAGSRRILSASCSALPTVEDQARPAAPLLAALGFSIAAWTRRPRSEAGIACHAGPEGLPAFLAMSDIVVMLLPLTPETEDVIDAQTLAMMKPGAALINLARGKHVDEGALLAALDSGHVSAATLDVFRTEPLAQDSPFWDHPRVTVMPHTARRVSPEAIVPQLMDAIRRVETGRPLVNLADRKAGY
jgi:glyoxylate/hydroxypyruvate reductase A